MTILAVMVIAVVVLFVGGRLYSNYISRSLGEDASRPTPAVVRADGRDFVPTPTPVVFAHHFASIAGAGPILGPVFAVIFGWVPALLWVLLGGVLIGAVHDYLATYMATREGGTSMASIVHRMIGKGPFVAITIFLVVMLALVCAAFLNASATALTSMLPYARLDLARDQTIFRVVGEGEDAKVVIGGIASMSVVCITAVAPLIGYLYIKRKVSVWICSALAVAICGASIAVGVFRPIALEPMAWKLALSAYVLVAAGVPVWIFLQSRDFINVHILYVGMVALLVTLVVAGLRGASVPAEAALPRFNISEGSRALGLFWPTMFIVIACGAVSGFHSLCAGGTTCKQLKNERATRQIGYYGMLLESFLAVCVIAVFMIGAVKADYIRDVHPIKLLGLVDAKANPVLGFAMAVGNAARLAYGVPVAVGALAGMVLLEGFLVTTLDTAIRLTRYLIEEVWRTLLGKYDVFAEPVAVGEAAAWGEDEPTPRGAGGIPLAPEVADQPPAPAEPVRTSGLLRGVLKVMRLYWVNSAIAVALMLAFAMTGGQKALWKIFATSNQLLAAMVLSIASLWLLRQGKRFWFAFVPGVLMLITTVTNLVLMLKGFLSDPQKHATLLTADVLILAITIYLVIAGAREAVRFLAHRRRDVV
jgi:carbon starvation protein